MSTIKSKRVRRVAVVGNVVKVRFGCKTERAKIVENRGPIGKGGRILVRVQLLKDKAQPDASFEVPLEDLTAIKP